MKSDSLSLRLSKLRSYHVPLVQIELKRKLQGMDATAVSRLLINDLQSLGITDFDTLLGLYIQGTGCNDADCLVILKEVYHDALFKCPVLYFSDYLSSVNHIVFSYTLNYEPEMAQNSDWDRHNDLAMLFGEPLGGAATSIERNISKKMIDIVSGFAKNGWGHTI
ncbi:hypothetical protein MTO96_022502 [Rhipicephalus appendiculatus]